MNRKSKNRAGVPRNRREYEDQLDAFAVLALMRREKLPATLAAKAEGVPLKRVIKYVRPALRKRGKDFVAKPSDRLARKMITLDARGKRFIEVRSSKAATQVARHLNAVDKALKGKPSGLREFHGKKIPYNKGKFLTSVKAIHRLQDAGVLEGIKEIYWHGRKC